MFIYIYIYLIVCYVYTIIWIEELKRVITAGIIMSTIVSVIVCAVYNLIIIRV